MLKITKRLRNIAAGSLLALGAVASSSAFAAAVFQVNPNSNGLSTDSQVFFADAMSGVSSARVTYAGTGFNYTSVGYIDYASMSLADQSVNGNVSGVNTDYGLYATFTQGFACTSLLGPGVTCQTTSINLSLYGDAGDNNTYNSATLTTDASVTTNGVQILLGTVDQVIFGTAGIDAAGGAFQNVNTNFKTTAAGGLYFIAPSPFYSFAFSAFNNTSQGIECDTAGCVNALAVAITQESGITDFLGEVPEPAPLALIGLGLLGMCWSRRKGQASV